MMLVQLVQHITPCLADVGSWLDISHASHSWIGHSLDWSLLAQQFDTDVFKGTRTILNNFVKSGQLWAFLIGIVVGYIFRSVTSYG